MDADRALRRRYFSLEDDCYYPCHYKSGGNGRIHTLRNPLTIPLLNIPCDLITNKTPLSLHSLCFIRVYFNATRAPSSRPRRALIDMGSNGWHYWDRACAKSNSPFVLSFCGHIAGNIQRPGGAILSSCGYYISLRSNQDCPAQHGSDVPLSDD
ncbi:hypothetical protein BD779DRAFT_1119673 [Infundibulicybe gibba]|nr:hypothetical protein BD779DRAFT_1119673 [Infundibulicybe gibba]